MVSYCDRNLVLLLQNPFPETLNGNVVPYEALNGVAPFVGVLEDATWATGYARCVSIAFAVIDQDIGQGLPKAFSAEYAISTRLIFSNREYTLCVEKPWAGFQRAKIFRCCWFNQLIFARMMKFWRPSCSEDEVAASERVSLALIPLGSAVDELRDARRV